jgi:competence protein ComEC
MTIPGTPLGECFFLDVGQGTANAVLLPGGRALIIDVGPSNAWPVMERLLRDRGLTSIDCLLISHNDEDHIGGLDQCAMTFGDLIVKGGFFILQDRPIQPGDALDLTLKMVDEKLIPEPQRAEAASIEEPTVIWQSNDLSLELWYPSMTGAVRAASRRRPNDCCAVALLRTGAGKILFTGDAGTRSWQALSEARPGFVLEVDIITVPHHGGGLGGHGPGPLENLVKAKMAIISVGSNNAFDHPKPDVIAACSRSGVHVFCTQITNQCHSLAALDGGHVIDVSEHSLSHSSMGAMRASRGVATGCAGTVVATLHSTGIEVPRQSEHSTAVHNLSSPLCLHGARPQMGAGGTHY